MIYMYILYICIIYLVNFYIYIYRYRYKIKQKLVHDTQSVPNSKSKERNTYIVNSCRHKAIVVIRRMSALDCLHDFT